MNDYINGRRQAIDAWKEDFKGFVNSLDMPRDDYKGIMEYIDEVPSAQPEQQWIPVTERLPEKTGEYLVWMIWVCEEYPTHSIIHYDADCEAFGEWHDHYHPQTFGYLDSDFEEIKGVIAWMPLPAPYKGGDADD